MNGAAGAVLLMAAGAAALLYMDNAQANVATVDTGFSGLDNAGADWMNTLNTNASVGDPNTNLRAFLDMLAMSEGTYWTGDNGYNVVVGGTTFDNGYAEHPRIVVRTRWGNSDAAGRYQIMAAVPGKITTNTWDWISAKLGLQDFSPASQDSVAIYILQWKGAYNDVLSGNVQSAIAKVAGQWASLPGAPYGQSPHDMGTVMAWYQQAGGALA